MVRRWRAGALRPERGRGLTAGDAWCHCVPAELGIPLRASRGVTPACTWFAPGLLRQTAPRLAWHPVDSPTAPTRGQPSTLAVAGSRPRAALPLRRRVVALVEVVGVSRFGHPETCPAGRGPRRCCCRRALPRSAI